jgi:hypothetical protein
MRWEVPMSEEKGFMADELTRLRELRDELRVQAKLGQAELRDRWEELEHRWHQLEGRLKLARAGLREDGEDVRAAARQLAKELREGYQHLRERL